MHADDLSIKSGNLICVIIFYFQDQNVAQDARLTAVSSQLQQLQVSPQHSCNYAISRLRLRTVRGVELGCTAALREGCWYQQINRLPANDALRIMRLSAS